MPGGTSPLSEETASLPEHSKCLLLEQCQGMWEHASVTHRHSSTRIHFLPSGLFAPEEGHLDRQMAWRGARVHKRCRQKGESPGEATRTSYKARKHQLGFNLLSKYKVPVEYGYLGENL